MIKKYHEYKLILEADENEEEVAETETEEEVEEPDTEEQNNYAQNASYYATEALSLIELKLIKLFEEPVNKEDIDPTSYYAQGIELVELKKTDMPLNKTLILKFLDSQFVYHVLFTIKIDQGLIDQKVSKDDSTDITTCGLKFKKYDLDEDLVGQIDRMNVNIEDIDQDFIDKLNAELDQKYSIVGDDFEIEYKDE